MTSQIAAGTGHAWSDALIIWLMLAWHLRWWILGGLAVLTIVWKIWRGRWNERERKLIGFGTQGGDIYARRSGLRIDVFDQPTAISWRNK